MPVQKLCHRRSPVGGGSGAEGGVELGCGAGGGGDITITAVADRN